MAYCKQPERRGKKKLIVAVLMHYDPFSKVYNCKYCDKDDKKARGCKRNKRYVVMQVECVCSNDAKCAVCKGKGQFTLKRCPLNSLNDRDVTRFLPHFFRWREFGHYPDGQGAIYQPVKFLSALSVCSIVAKKRERINKDRVTNG